MEKQTAVQWFYDQITRTYWDYMTTERQNELFEQANAMFEEQIKSAFNQGETSSEDYFDPNNPNVGCSENYFDQTFNS